MVQITRKITWNHQIIQGHTMEARINEPLFMPPCKGIGYMLRVSTEVMIKLVTKVGFGRGGKCWEIIEDVLR